jgi:Histidine kinase/Y_Y_Y domain/Two component regulator propeller
MLPASKNLCLWKKSACSFRSLLHIIPLLLLSILNSASSTAQEYSYVNYDVKDGLAGSTVYDLCQDKFGFLWFATEAGVSRFDGTHFKNFTTADGLPETEIIKLYADSKGRVWMSPFKNAVCYYYNGKIHNQENDSLLKPVKLSSVVLEYANDEDSNVLFSTATEFYIVKKDAEENNKIAVRLIDYLSKPAEFSAIKRNSPFIDHDSVFIQTTRTGKRFLFALNPVHKDPHTKVPKPPRQFTSLYKLPQSDKVLFLNTYDGAWMVDTLNPGNYTEVFLKGKPVSNVYIDNEKNFWFATLGSGVYKLVSQDIKTFNFNSKTSEIFSLEKQHGKLIAGSAFSYVYSIKGLKVDTLDFASEFANSPNKFSANRLVSMSKIDKDNVVLGFDGFMLVYNSKTGKRKVAYLSTVKSVDMVDSATLLVGLSANTFLVNRYTFAMIHRIWPHRSTAVSYYNNKYYIGTLNGLYSISKNKAISFLGDSFPALRNRISYFAKSADGGIWVATYGGGVVYIKNDKVISNITVKQGLTSNVCRSLFLDKSTLWVGTDKGLNRVDLSTPAFHTRRYTIADGLPSHIINAIYVDSNYVYVGSPAGLTFFDERKVSTYSNCSLKILEIAVSNVSQPTQDAYQLSHKNNNLKISYAGISFRSAGDIWYRYRLKGLTDAWDSTRQNLLEYPSLPPGNYELEMLAINKFGVESKKISIPIYIAAAFWQTLWFQLSIIAASVMITWLLVTWRFRTIRKREREKNAIQQRMNDLEQMALRSQMNPHFIFNCLNSIQNFIINHNVEATNWYLTEFAHLIRQTLDNSDKATISITNEIKYLQRYLELEKMRFGNSFAFKVQVDPGIDRDFTCIPTMILQPYVENSIRHGIRHKKSGGGHIDIKFSKNRHELLCIVEDNGIGRKKSNEFKSHMHVEYQSKGMSLTAERINILNRQQPNPITIEVIDLADMYNQPSGTRVVIHFPGILSTKFN